MNPQHYATHNPQQQQQQFYGSAGAYATQSGVNMSANVPLHLWVPPSPAEQQYYDMLFSLVDEQRRNAIGGQQAVAFFTRSHLDKAILREVWSIADVQRRSELSRSEFYVAMRLIVMAQRGEQVSVQRFFQLAAMQYPLPMLEGVPPPQGMQPGMHPAAPPQPQAQPQMHVPQQQDFGSVHQPQPSSTGAAYALTADEKNKYDIVFQQYDNDHDGFLMGPEAVALFQMSGLDRNVLRDIWTMADVTQDSKLSVQEFYVAMHLIVCISKRGLPMPPTLPRELGETAFSAAGAAHGVPAHEGFGSQTSGPPSQNGFGTPQQESVPPPKPEGMSAFDSLSSIEDAPLPSLASSTPRSSRANSFNHADTSAANSHAGGFGEPSVPTPTGSFHGGFSAPTAQQDFNGFSAPPRAPSVTSGAGRDRTNSASSMNSMSSFSGMAPLPPQQASQQLPPRNFGSSDRIQMQPESAGFSAPPQGYPGFGAGSFGAPSPGLLTAPEKPFMSDEEEKKVVSQLDQQNVEVVNSLAAVERKQTAIEMISEKLRDLDELRHELVTLVMKREDLRVSSATASAVSDNSGETEQSRHAVERSLRALIENQKQVIHQLQCDISKHEGELEEAVLSAKLQQKLSLESRSPLIDAASPPPSRHGSTGASGVPGFVAAPLSLDESSALPSPVAAPSAPSLSAFSPGATDSSGFNAFSNFDSAPHSIPSATPSPAAAALSGSPFSPTPSPSQSAIANDSLNALGDFAAPPSTAAAPSPLAGVSDAPGKSPFSPTPSPAAVNDSTGFDGFGSVAAPSSSPAAAVEVPADSPFSPFSPSPSPAANDSNAFGDFGAAPSAPPTAAVDAPGNSSFSPTPSPAAAGSASGDFSSAADFAAPSASPAANADTSENSVFSPAPSPAATENSSFDAFATAPLPNDVATPAKADSSANSPFSPVAADNSSLDTFGDFGAAPASADNAVLSSEPTAQQDTAENLLPSPVAATETSSGFDTFGDFGAASASTEPAKQDTSDNLLPSPAAASATSDFSGFGDFNAPPASTDSATSAPGTGHSPFSPVAADSSDFNGFGDFNAAPASADASAAPSGASCRSPFSPVATESGIEAFGEFNAAPTDSAATPSEPVKTASASGCSPFSPVAADSSSFEAFGDFNAAPTTTESFTEAAKPAEVSASSPFSPAAADSDSFEVFGDFNAAPASTDSAKPNESSDSSGFEAFGDFNAATTSTDDTKPATTNESDSGFEAFGDFNAAAAPSSAASDSFGDFK